MAKKCKHMASCDDFAVVWVVAVGWVGLVVVVMEGVVTERCLGSLCIPDDQLQMLDETRQITICTFDISCKGPWSSLGSSSLVKG